MSISKTMLFYLIPIIVFTGLNSCCSGDDSAGDSPVMRTQLFNADQCVNLFSFEGPYEHEDIKIYLSDGLTLSQFDPPGLTGVIPLSFDLNDAEAAEDNRISTFL